MAKFLITGGAGFIGGNFLHLAVNNYPNNKYVCIDALTYAGHLETLTPIIKKKNFKFIKLNICDRAGINKLFKQERFDYVINFAAETHVDRSIVDPEIFLKSNVIGVQVLLDACLKYGVKRFHQVSTDEVYGDLPLNRKDLLFDENSYLRPSSPYSASKAAADLLVLSYFRTYKLPITISRCSNNFGPYQHPEKLIPLLIINALGNKPLPIYGKGLNVRDWLYVIDHCEAINLIIERGKPGEIYNIGSHNEYNNTQIAKIILKELNKSTSLIKQVKDRPGHDLRYAMNPKKIMNELKWKSKSKFLTTIKSTINWYQNNQKWISAVVAKDR